MLDEVELGGVDMFAVPRAGLRRGRFRLSRVTPLPSFVKPTTGGSPFLQNSQRPRPECVVSMELLPAHL